jgi:hypothetical protein
LTGIPESEGRDAVTCTWRPSTGRCRYQVSAARHECVTLHSGLSWLIVRIKSRMSAGTAGRPTRRRDLATPVQTEAAPMPAHQRLRLEDNRGFKQGGAQPIEPDKDQAICRAQPEPRRRGSLQHNKLLAEKCHLGFAGRMRSEHPDEQSAEPLQEVDHPGDESSPSRQLRQPGCDFRYPQVTSTKSSRNGTVAARRSSPARSPSTNGMPSSAADTILDRLVHNAHRIGLAGESLRRRRSRSTPQD